jgi:glycosyltransferase involved in cell wall biosynthesis
MRLAFVNPNLAHDYDADTPFEKALPGSESAQVYLALALARRGHAVSLFSGTTKGDRRLRGLDQARWAGALPGDWDAIFVTSAPELVPELRAAHPNPPIFAWAHNVFVPGSSEDAALKALSGPRDRILCVSNWHKANFTAHGLEPARVVVLRNAIGPAFENLYAPGESVTAAKSVPARAAFASVPYKGLKQALAFFKDLRAARNDATLDVFSSFDFYPDNNFFRHQPSWKILAHEARNQQGVVSHGNVPQAELARALKAALLLFYPNVAAETASIATMEAMAAGCVVVTTALGALPETTGEFGLLAPVVEGRIDPQSYVSAATAIMDAFAQGNLALDARLRAQVEWVNATYRWDIRAEEAETLIGGTP